MQNKQTLYCITSKGKVQQWSIWTQGPWIFTEAGQLDGKLRENSREAKPKNVGKSNETTGTEQALTEMQSKINLQRDKGYKCTVEEATEFWYKTDTEGFSLPQLLTNDMEKVVFPGDIQPKLDGIRCQGFITIDGVRLRSREGKEIPVASIRNAIAQLGLPVGTIIDGEIYSTSDFQSIISMVKDPKKDQSRLYLSVYDIVFAGDYSMPWQKRLAYLKRLLPENSVLRMTLTERVNSEAEMLEWHERFKSLGFEGSVWRNLSGPYKASFRSANVIKIKDFDDAEFEIISGVPGEGLYANACIYICETSTGGRFRCTAPGTIPQKEKALQNIEQAIGKMLTVQYQGLTNDGIPRFPVAKAIRDYE